MKNALQAQLLKAGLADSRKIKKANAQQAHQKRLGQETEHEIVQREVQQKLQQKEIHDRELAAREKQAKEAAEHQQRLEAILASHAVARETGDLAYQFLDGARIKKLYLAARQHARIVQGQLLVARGQQDDVYFLLPYPLFERVNQLWPAAILVNNRNVTSPLPDEDDPYAAYVIPDDLMW